MKLIIEPDDGVTPLVRGIKNAKKSIDIVIFRFDRPEMEKALEVAVGRGVNVRALIAHTNRGGEKTLRKLETRMLAMGITVARTADDLPRYHGKMMIIDDTLYVLGFNYTKLDMEKSRSFGVVTRDAKLVKDAASLFEADCARQTYAPMHDKFVVSPETSRARLTSFIKGARKQLCIYDEKVTDNLIQRLLEERAKAGVEIRVIGKVEKTLAGVETRKLQDLRLHVRAIVRDGSAAFVGSQSLRKLELDGRREVGVLIGDTRVAKKIQAVFEADWEHAAVTKPAVPVPGTAAAEKASA
ncbi:MAG TPA: phospholipase D-like domain-containing protein [Vicinamibacterales bacterium]|nr:phospholipase D-like domain-containing protein [Vicinamibacterales bacterium]